MHTRNSTFRTASTLAEIGSDRWTTVAVEVAAQYGVELHWTEDGCFEAVGPPLIIDCSPAGAGQPGRPSTRGRPLV